MRVLDLDGMISNAKVYGLDESVRASKLPKSVDPQSCTDEITGTVERLGNAPRGSGHDNYLKGIVVQFDWKFSIKLSPELERYHWIDIVSSQSTMHCVTKFSIDEQCNEYVDDRAKAVLRERVCIFNADPTPENYLRVLYNIPTGFCLTARISTNYQQLKTIYGQRWNHRLPEWRRFCEWILTLPEFVRLTGCGTRKECGDGM